MSLLSPPPHKSRSGNNFKIFFSPLLILFVLPSPSFFSLPVGVFGLSSVALDNGCERLFLSNVLPSFLEGGCLELGDLVGSCISFFLGPVGFSLCGQGLVPPIILISWCKSLNAIFSKLQPAFSSWYFLFYSLCCDGVVSNVALVFPWGAPYVLTPSYPESTNLPTSHIQFQRRIHSIAPFPTRIKATFLCGMGAIAPMRPFQIWYVECHIFVPPLRNRVWCESFFPLPTERELGITNLFWVFGLSSFAFLSLLYIILLCVNVLSQKNTSCPNLSLFFVQKIFFFVFRTKISFWPGVNLKTYEQNMKK